MLRIMEDHICKVNTIVEEKDVQTSPLEQIHSQTQTHSAREFLDVIDKDAILISIKDARKDVFTPVSPTVASAEGTFHIQDSIDN